MNLQKLCLDLATTEDGNDVVKLLKKNNLWDNEKEWKSVGFHENKDQNNAAIITNQQSNPANALVEKLINCGDSALTLLCKEKEIDPKGEGAPKNVTEAIESLLDIDYGRWNNASTLRRNSLGSEYCNLVVTGMFGKGKEVCPTYTVIDRAEGQAPEKFRDTFLSLNKNNKVEIPFVQGKFGMGSYGAVNFCTVHGLQLIISKRNPKVQDGLSSKWGFTVIRKFPPTPLYRSSRWMYLTIDGEMPSFEANNLKIAPGNYPNAYGEKFEHGTFVKMFNYDIGSGLRAAATLDLNVKLNTLLVNPVVPVRIFERRSYPNRPKSPEVTLDGLETRLERDREGVIAEGFPSDFRLNVEGQEINGKIYVFNRYNSKGEKIDPTRYGNGVLFCLNGQANGNLGSRFFYQGQRLKFQNISRNILVMLDCSSLSYEYIEKVFQPDRERIMENQYTKEIKEELTEVLSLHQGLKDFQNSWRQQEITQKKEDGEKFTSIIENLIAKDNNIARLLDIGIKVNNPFKKGDLEKEIFKPSLFPTFFRLKKEYPITKPRGAEKERDVRIAFETDAPNDYFNRPKDPGNIKVFFGDQDITHKHNVKFRIFNGQFTLHLPERPEQIQKYSYFVSDIKNINEPYQGDFYLKLVEKVEKKKSEKKQSKNSRTLEIPEPIRVTKADYDQYEFDHDDGLCIEEDQNGKTFYYLNADNKHLHNYCKTVKNEEVEAVKHQFEISMMLIGLMVNKQFQQISEKKLIAGSETSEVNLRTYSKSITRSIAPILLPIVRQVGAMFN